MLEVFSAVIVSRYFWREVTKSMLCPGFLIVTRSLTVLLGTSATC